MGAGPTRPIRPLARSSTSSEYRVEERGGVRVVGYHHFVQSIATAFELVPGTFVGGTDGPALGEMLDVVGNVGVKALQVSTMGKAYRAMEEGRQSNEELECYWKLHCRLFGGPVLQYTVGNGCQRRLVVVVVAVSWSRPQDCIAWLVWFRCIPSFFKAKGLRLCRLQRSEKQIFTFSHLFTVTRTNFFACRLTSPNPAVNALTLILGIYSLRCFLLPTFIAPPLSFNTTSSTCITLLLHVLRYSGPLRIEGSLL